MMSGLNGIQHTGSVSELSLQTYLYCVLLPLLGSPAWRSSFTGGSGLSTSFEPGSVLAAPGGPELFP